MIIKYFQCKECGIYFEVISQKDKIKYAVCPECGSDDVDYTNKNQSEVK